MPSTQTVHLGPHDAPVAAAMRRLEQERFFRRLWDGDAALWAADAATQVAIQRRLGWLSIVRAMAPQAASFRRCAEELREAGFTHALLLGMGGSGLFAEVCRRTFGVASGHLNLAVLDSTDPAAIRTQQHQCPAQQLAIIVSSKSGSTSEIAALSRYFYETFKSVNAHPGAHCVAITDAGTPLEAQARAWGFRRAFVHGAGTGAEVGGRFSALTAFGLVPAALIGVETPRLLDRAEEMFSRCAPEAPLADNPAGRLGAALGACAGEGREKLTLVCDPELESFGTWAEQLIAESLGKQGRGIIPICGEPLREPAAYAADRVFVRVALASNPPDAMDRRLRALEQAGHPVVRIHWQDRYDLGGEVAKWSLATAVAGALLGVNPFDQPNVQESKDRTEALLDRYRREGRLPAVGVPVCQDAEMIVHGAVGAEGSPSLARCLGRFLEQRRARDYFALLSFLPRTPALDGGLAALRAQLGERLGHATMLGFGPRYLHSTGQLYKGGPDSGLFLLLTSDEQEDLPIPGEPFSFGALKQAQALGDFQAMQERGRRILRVHLGAHPEAAFPRLARALDEAVSRRVSR